MQDAGSFKLMNAFRSGARPSNPLRISFSCSPRLGASSSRCAGTQKTIAGSLEVPARQENDRPLCARFSAHADEDSALPVRLTAPAHMTHCPPRVVVADIESSQSCKTRLTSSAFVNRSMCSLEQASSASSGLPIGWGRCRHWRSAPAIVRTGFGPPPNFPPGKSTINEAVAGCGSRKIRMLADRVPDGACR